MEILIYGIINSVSLALMALGFTLVYGVSRLPNFAHGALYVLTVYMTWIFMNRLGLNYPLSIVSSLIASAAIVRPCTTSFWYCPGMPISEIIASYAIGLAILEDCAGVGSKEGHSSAAFHPRKHGAIWYFCGFPSARVVAAGIVLVTLLWLFVNGTKIGLALKGMAQDERAL